MHCSCLRALLLTASPMALNCRSTPALASRRAAGQGSPSQLSSPSEIRISTRLPDDPRSSTALPSEYAIGVSPLASNESTARNSLPRFSGPIGSTSSVSVQAFGFCSLGSAISDPYTRRPTWVPAGTALATRFTARWAAANLVPPEEMRSFIEPETSSRRCTLAASSAVAGSGVTRSPVAATSRASPPSTACRSPRRVRGRLW